MDSEMPSQDFLPRHIAAYLPIPIFIFFALTYTTVAPYFQMEKKRAYILSTLSSATMSLISLPFVYQYTFHGLGVVYEKSQNGWMGSLARFGVVFFGTYLFGELSFLNLGGRIALMTS